MMHLLHISESYIYHIYYVWLLTHIKTHVISLPLLNPAISHPWYDALKLVYIYPLEECLLRYHADDSSTSLILPTSPQSRGPVARG